MKSRYFDPKAPLGIKRGRLPHWSQAGTICFITWRTADSLPTSVLEKWNTERRDWLLARGIDPATDRDWKLEFQNLSSAESRSFHARFTKRWQDALDKNHGACLLRRPALSEIVAQSLMAFHGERYEMQDYVVMPNHVHLLASFPSEEVMLTQCTSWKHFTAAQINKATGRKGRFWQSEAFDHLVRNENQWDRLRRYIAENPTKAGLRPGEYRVKE